MIEILENETVLKPEERALIEKACTVALLEEKAKGDITVMVSTPAQIQMLNRDFRHIDKVTDVLTFPAWEGEDILSPQDGYLGDIMICLDRAKEQALEYGHSLSRELAFLAVHGVLHILGYDHMDAQEEEIMRERQREILSKMGEER